MTPLDGPPFQPCLRFPQP